MSEYDIAVSFADADEQRLAVEEVVEACRQRGLTVLYGPEQTHEWWARKTEEGQARFFVPFVSALDDFTAAMLRAVKAGERHVLPVLAGDVAVPAELLHPHVSYLHLDRGLADALFERVEQAESAGWDHASLATVVTRARETEPPATVPISFSRYAEQDATMRYLGEQFAAAVPGLRRQGYVGTAHYSDARIALRIERAGDVVYALDIQRGGLGGDETVNFVVGRHDTGSACTNGWARPVYDTATATPKLELHDRSILGGTPNPRLYTKEDLFTTLWTRITTQLTQ